jgi:hypothetical protein
MARWAYLLVAFTTLAAWAGAQTPAPPAPLAPEDKLRLLRANTSLIENLVRDGVALSAAHDSIQRASRCRDASLSLANAIGEAANAENAERVAVLTNLFRDVVRDGLVPTLTEARNSVPPQSPGAQQVRDLQSLASNDIIRIQSSIPSSGAMGDSPRIKDARKQLEDLAEALNAR